MLSVRRNPKIDLIDKIDLELPSGIDFQPAKIGTGVFATKSFKKGEVLYSATSLIVPNKDFTIELYVQNHSQPFYLHAGTHTVHLDDSKRELFPYDSFMNHCCDPNSEMVYSSPSSETDSSERHYEMVSVKDVSPGDEITCDYTLFDYDCHGHEISMCLCGSSECCGGRVGFKFLPKEKQIAKLSRVTQDVLENYLKDHPEEAGTEKQKQQQEQPEPEEMELEKENIPHQ
jgi:hypothetical protein